MAGGAARAGKVIRALQALGVECFETRCRGDATGLARRLADAGYRVVVAAGGDGTVNEVVNGLAAAPRGLSDVLLALLPIGTGNDLAHCTGVAGPRGALAALERAADGGARTLRLDLLRLENGRGVRYAVDVLDAGITAATQLALDQLRFRTAGEPGAWPVRAASGMKRYDARIVAVPARPAGVAAASRDPVPAADDTPLAIPGPVSAVIAMNGPVGFRHTRLACAARMDDGLMDVLVIPGVSLLEAAALAAAVLRGKGERDPRIIRFQTPELAVDGPGVGRMPVCADGESAGGGPFRVKVEHSRLALLGPVP